MSKRELVLRAAESRVAVRLAAERPADDSPRAIHRFRRRTEPWALSALAFLGATDLYDAVRAARAAEARRVEAAQAARNLARVISPFPGTVTESYTLSGDQVGE